MKAYFDSFDKILGQLGKCLDEDKGVDPSVVNPVFDKMEQIATQNPKLGPQKKNVEFYKRTTESIFKEGVSSGYKVSAYGQLKREKELLEEFAKTHGLI